MDIFKPGVLNVPNTEWNHQVLCVTFPEWRGLKWAIVGSGYPGGWLLLLSLSAQLALLIRHIHPIKEMRSWVFGTKLIFCTNPIQG